MSKVQIDGQHQLAAILHASRDALIAATLERVVVSWSRGAEEIYGYSAAEIVGHSLDVLIPPEQLGQIEQVLRAVARGEAVAPYEVIHFDKAGQPLQIEISLAPIRDDTNAVCGALAVVRDITAHRDVEGRMRALEVAAHHRAVVMETANHVALDILSSRTGVEALRHIAEAARVLAGARYGALGVARCIGDDVAQGQQELQEFITVGITPDEQARIGPLPRGKGILGLLLERTEPLRVDHLAAHPASVGFPPHHPPMESFLGVPIRRGETTVGSLYLTNKQGGGAFSEADEVAVQALGAHAAVAIHNMQMLSRQRALVAGLITAQEEERRAVAYDLHDGLTQYVMASHAHLQAFQRAHQIGKADKAARELEDGLKYLKEAVMESRRMVNGLRPLALDDLGVAGAIEQLISEEKARCGWQEAELVQAIGERRFDKEVEIGVYRVAQEALTNVRKHAGSCRVQVRLDWAGETSQTAPNASGLRLQVRDWGRGFNLERVVEAGHFGLQSMAERVRLLGGTYAVRSVPGEGTVVEAVFPLLSAAAPSNDQTGDETAIISDD